MLQRDAEMHNMSNKGTSDDGKVPLKMLNHLIKSVAGMLNVNYGMCNSQSLSQHLV